MYKKAILLSIFLIFTSINAIAESFLDRATNNGITLSQFVKKTDDCLGGFDEFVLKKNGLIQKSHGNFWWKQGAWKWEYLDKNNQIDLVMIDDVKQSVQIDKGLNQVIVNASKLEVSPISLFTSKLDTQKYDIKYLKDNDCCEIFEVHLKSNKNESISLQSDNAIIWMDKRSSLPKKIMYKTLLGDVVNIMLNNVKINTKLQSSDFSYTVGSMDLISNIK